MWTDAAFEKLPWYLSNRYLRFKIPQKIPADEVLSVSDVRTFADLGNAEFAKNGNCFTHAKSQRNATSLSPRKPFPPVDTLWDLILRFMARVCWIIDVSKSLQQSRCLHQATKSCEKIILVEKKFFPGDVPRQKRRKIQFSAIGSSTFFSLVASYFRLILQWSSKVLRSHTRVYACYVEMPFEVENWEIKYLNGFIGLICWSAVQ